MTYYYHRNQRFAALPGLLNQDGPSPNTFEPLVPDVVSVERSPFLVSLVLEQDDVEAFSQGNRKRETERRAVIIQIQVYEVWPVVLICASFLSHIMSVEQCANGCDSRISIAEEHALNMEEPIRENIRFGNAKVTGVPRDWECENGFCETNELIDFDERPKCGLIEDFLQGFRPVFFPFGLGYSLCDHARFPLTGGRELIVDGF